MNLLRIALAFCFLLAAACDKSGVHDLGRASDTLSVCDGATSTWIRSLNDGSEVFVLGTRSPGSGRAEGCYAHAVVRDDSTVDMETGTFNTDDAGAGTAFLTARYDFLFEADETPTTRMGARRDDLDPPEEVPLQLTMDGEQLLVSLDGAQQRLTSLPNVIRLLDPTTQAGAEDLFRLTNIQFYMTNARIEGFSSTGMTQYTVPTEFVGIAAGSYRVAVQGGINITTDITFTGLRDMTDIQIDGNQRTRVDWSGDGPASDVLVYTIDHPDGDDIEYIIYYEDLQILNGAAGADFYTVEANGNTFTLDWSIAQDVHIRNILPVGQ